MEYLDRTVDVMTYYECPIFFIVHLYLVYISYSYFDMVKVLFTKQNEMGYEIYN